MLDARRAPPWWVTCRRSGRAQPAYFSVGELTVRAAVDGDPRLVLAAAMLDPNTAATLTVDAIWELCDELTAAHGALLPKALRSPARL